MPFEKETAKSQEGQHSSASTAITLMKQRLSNFETEKGRLHGLAYQPRNNDIGISTTPKAGTTWVQQICHQIRCAGSSQNKDCSMDFIEISYVVPWIELAYDQKQDLESEQPPLNDPTMPRLFKTHCWYDHCPKFPKTIVVLRDPCDVLLSFYKFFENCFFDAGSIDLDTFADEFWLQRGIPDDTKMQNASYFVHLISWYEQYIKNRDDDSSLSSSQSKILIVFFEDLKEDLEKQVRKIAQFMSDENHNFDQEDIIRHATHHGSFSFMKQHESQFDEKLSKLARNEACGLSKDAGMSSSKLREGSHGGGKLILSDELKAKIQQKWKEVVLPVTGCATYAELRTQLST